MGYLYGFVALIVVLTAPFFWFGERARLFFKSIWDISFQLTEPIWRLAVTFVVDPWAVLQSRMRAFSARLMSTETVISAGCGLRLAT
jgi:hypothetical protein